MPEKYQCPLFIWKTGKMLVNVLQALTDKWEVRKQDLGEMVELRISVNQNVEPLTLNLFVLDNHVLWGYIDLPVTSQQIALLQELTNQLKTKTGAEIGPSKRRMKFKFEGESIETETTTAEVYSWTMNYGLRYSLQQITRFLTALDSALRENDGRGIEGNEFFVTYRDGNLHLQEPSLSFVLVSNWGYYSAFLYVGEDSLELQVCDEEKEKFPAEDFDKVVQTAVNLFESDKEIILKDA
ncbi:MAG: hypothetical protein ACFFBU_05770 [Promethearchaeota archaeon]